MNDCHVLSFVHAVPSQSLLWPKARFLVRGLARSETLCVVKKKSWPARGYRESASMASQVTFHEQKQFKNTSTWGYCKAGFQKHLQKNNNGSVRVVRCQPQEKKGPIKINLCNEREDMYLYSFSIDSCQRAQEIGRSSQKLSITLSIHRKATATHRDRHVESYVASCLRAAVFTPAFE